MHILDQRVLRFVGIEVKDNEPVGVFKCNNKQGFISLTQLLDLDMRGLFASNKNFITSLGLDYFNHCSVTNKWTLVHVMHKKESYYY